MSITAVIDLNTAVNTNFNLKIVHFGYCVCFVHTLFFFLNHIMPIIVSDDGQGMFSFQCLTDAYVHGATQDDKSPPPCMQLQARVAVVLTYPTPNELLRLVGGSPTPSTCNASPNDPQRVITTCWGLFHPFHLQCQPHRPPTSHYD